MSLVTIREMDIQPGSADATIVKAINTFLARLKWLSHDKEVQPGKDEQIEFYFRKQLTIAVPQAFSSLELEYYRLLCYCVLPAIHHGDKVYQHGFCTFIRRTSPGSRWGVTTKFVLASHPNEFRKLEPHKQWAPFSD